jgi:hypothetical protein
LEQKMKHMRVNRLFIQISLFLTVLAMCDLFYSLGIQPQGSSRFITSPKWMSAGVVGLLVLAGLTALFLVSWTQKWDRVEQAFNSFHSILKRVKLLNLLPVLAFIFVFIVLVYMPFEGLFKESDLFADFWIRLSILWILGMASTPFIAALLPSLSAAEALLGAIFSILLAHKIFSFLPGISSYPFSLGWSESSRYYYASLFFSGKLYGARIPWSYLHPSRYLLQSIPFLVSGLPLWFHRLWQVLLWLGLTGLTSMLFIRRLSLHNRNLRWLGAAWAFFFIFQGPVYYHLLVCVALVLWGFDGKKPWRSLAVVIIASAWAGISRINWFPVPAFLAISLYVLERAYSSADGFWEYWRWPAVWGAAGGAAALAAQSVYVLLSGRQDLSSFGSSFTSDLLWYRLWPNATYHPGVVPMILLLSLPLVILLAINLRSGHWHILRLLALGGMTMILFAGGLVVSTKIGGGGNLHNLDAYLIMLMLWGGYLLADRFEQESTVQTILKPGYMLFILALMPMVPLLGEGSPLVRLNLVVAKKELATLNVEVQDAVRAGGRVLFISQRQLLTFDLIDKVPLDSQYELLDLMEMAMSNNQVYLQQFYNDLETHQFDLIVVDRQIIKYQNLNSSFSAEDNVWIEKVSIPLLTYYQEKPALAGSDIQLLVPRGASQ